jgi:hypothetical protein
MSVITEFLKAIKKNGIILVATVFTEDMIQGSVFAFDDTHLVLDCGDGMFLIAIEDIHGISYHHQAEIIAP